MRARARKGVFIHPTAEVSDAASIGAGSKIWHQAQVREGARLGPNCILGKCAYIDKGVEVGAGCKIQNFASVYRGVVLGDSVFVGPGATFTNDIRPRAASQGWKIVPTKVGKGASIGANSTILCGVTIGEYAMVGAGAVVTRDVPAHALVCGNPAEVRGAACECGAELAKKQAGGKAAAACPACGAVYRSGGVLRLIR